MKSSVPATAWAFVAFVVVALVLLLLGAWVGVKVLLLVGLATVALLVVLLLLGAVC